MCLSQHGLTHVAPLLPPDGRGGATSVLPPFVSVDGYGLCCDFTEKCSVGAIRERGRSVRECIYSYGTCTNGVEYFHARD